MKSVFKTKIIKIDAVKPEEAYLREAAAILQQGGLVAFPTETVYGLGAAVTHPQAVQRVYSVKGRPADNPLIVHLDSYERLPLVAAAIPPAARRLAGKFWPGPLTMVLPKKATIPEEVSAGLPTVAVRVPAHPVALRLLALAGVPVAAPSANLSGRPSPTLGSHVAEDLDGLVEMILDAGPTGVGLESTVLDLTGKTPRILRPGGVTREMLEEVFGAGGVDEADPAAMESGRPLAPGMKYRHYAPKAPLYLVVGEPAKVNRYILDRLAEDEKARRKSAVLAYEEDREYYREALFFSLGERKKPEEAAERLFSLLRACDKAGAEAIYAVAPSYTGLGRAVFNRLWKAAGGNVVEVG
ncbi:MAG: threonylcarbamoyl-AMP synthase [Clostridia bacterium]|nr:threonylcarbamoyl-AMP synthase [Clostridia bacterium]